VLLTGEADLPSAIAAINKGRIFRFLCKPCPPAELAEAMSAAAEQHRLVTAERVLLEETLQGSIAALADVLAQTHPASFGRALRVKLLVGQLSEMAGLRSHWQVEIAATLSQLAAVTLPPETLAAWEAGETLRPEEQEMVARMPAFTDRVLSRIPRLEGVRRILADYAKHPHELDPTDAGQLTREARILRLAMDYDRFVAGGMSVELALAALGSCGDLYDADLLGFLGLLAQAARELELRRIPPKDLLPGMVLAEEIRTQGGVLLAARGYQISDSFVARISNLRAGTLHALLAVMVPAARP
jgi:response regulator RpfG family c-di-GMP phosphodiesterase